MSRLPAGLLGRELLWYAGEDPRRHLRLILDHEEVAYLEWRSTLPPRVKSEVLGDVWWVDGRGLRPFRVSATRAGSADPALLFVGSLFAGLVRTRGVAGYELRSRYAWRSGASSVLLNEAGSSVLSVRARIGGDVGGWALVASVAKEVEQLEDLLPLLSLWGTLRLCRLNAPWLSFTSWGVGVSAIERVMNELIRQMAGGNTTR